MLKLLELEWKSVAGSIAFGVVSFIAGIWESLTHTVRLVTRVYTDLNTGGRGSDGYSILRVSGSNSSCLENSLNVQRLILDVVLVELIHIFVDRSCLRMFGYINGFLIKVGLLILNGARYYGCGQTSSIRHMKSMGQDTIKFISESIHWILISILFTFSVVSTSLLDFPTYMWSVMNLSLYISFCIKNSGKWCYKNMSTDARVYDLQSSWIYYLGQGIIPAVLIRRHPHRSYIRILHIILLDVILTSSFKTHPNYSDLAKEYRIYKTAERFYINSAPTSRKVISLPLSITHTIVRKYPILSLHCKIINELASLTSKSNKEPPPNIKHKYIENTDFVLVNSQFKTRPSHR